jgi:hypothetical protein
MNSRATRSSTLNGGSMAEMSGMPDVEYERFIANMAPPNNMPRENALSEAKQYYNEVLKQAQNSLDQAEEALWL